MKRSIQALLLVVLVLLTGCGKTAQQPNSGANPVQGTTPATTVPASQDQTTAQQQPNEKQISVNLYFPDKQAMYLVKVPKQITVVDEAVVKAIIAELQKGDPDYGKVIPEEAKLLSASVKDGIVNLNFSKEFRDKHWGGSTGEEFTIYGIVDSLTELPNIKGVQFSLEGQIQTEMMGHYDWSKPFTRNESIIKK